MKTEAEKSKARRAAMERVIYGGDWRFIAAAMGAVQTVARQQADFTLDDVRPLVTLTPFQPCAWGGILLCAAQAGYCESTEEYRETTNPYSRQRKVRVWRSKLYDEAKASDGAGMVEGGAVGSETVEAGAVESEAAESETAGSES